MHHAQVYIRDWYNHLVEGDLEIVALQEDPPVHNKARRFGFTLCRGRKIRPLAGSQYPAQGLMNDGFRPGHTPRAASTEHPFLPI